MILNIMQSVLDDQDDFHHIDTFDYDNIHEWLKATNENYIFKRFE